MGTKLYGIVAAQNEDRAGETIVLDGVEDNLQFIRDEHENLNAFHILGKITYSKKIFSEKECENAKQLRCWNHVKVPFLYCEGELADDDGHPNAEAAAALLKFTMRPESRLKLGFSVDGGIYQRQTSGGLPTEDKEMGKILARTVAVSAALTSKPCNQKLEGGIFLENDLTKSDIAMAPPPIYFEYLKKSQASSSINDNKEIMLYAKVQKLKKSLDDYLGAFTAIKCHNCSKSVRFFKSTTSIPNSCESCRSNFSMNQIWKALNK